MRCVEIDQSLIYGCPHCTDSFQTGQLYAPRIQLRNPHRDTLTGKMHLTGKDNFTAGGEGMSTGKAPADLQQECDIRDKTAGTQSAA